MRLVVASTETMNQKNANALPEETMAAYRPIFERARRDDIELTGTIATAFGCPFEGAVDPDRVLGSPRNSSKPGRQRSILPIQ